MTTGFRGLDPCVHCGFCLPACPTYEVTSDEADSPRGRIVLMRALERGQLGVDDPGLQDHLDRCLGCRGCESVCPSGVLFGPALEEARARIAQARPLPWTLRLALRLLARPSRQGWLWFLARMLRATGLPARLARVRPLGMLAATKGAGSWVLGAGELPSIQHPTPSTLFLGCVQRGLFGHVHDATRVALAHNEFGCADAPGQVCCGALAAHAGAHALAVELARANVRAFAKTEGPIVVNSAGCGAMLKSYGDLLADDPLADDARAVAGRVRDVAEVLAERGPKPGTRAVPLRVAYDAPCHLVHAQRIGTAPLTMLAAIPGLTLVPLDGSERCCGSAGLYSLVEPEMSEDVLALKLDAIRRADPDVVATGNPGCIMQIGSGLLASGLDVVVCHPVELLARAYE